RRQRLWLGILALSGGEPAGSSDARGRRPFLPERALPVPPAAPRGPDRGALRAGGSAALRRGRRLLLARRAHARRIEENGRAARRPVSPTEPGPFAPGDAFERLGVLETLSYGVVWEGKRFRASQSEPLTFL